MKVFAVDRSSSIVVRERELGYSQIPKNMAYMLEAPPYGFDDIDKRRNDLADFETKHGSSYLIDAFAIDPKTRKRTTIARLKEKEQDEEIARRMECQL